MRARRAGHCPVCEADWRVGDQIKRLTGDWVHLGCKWETNIRVVEGVVTEPPVAFGYWERQQSHPIRAKSVERSGNRYGLPS